MIWDRFVSCALAGDVAKWREKLPVLKVLCATEDGRTTNGLRQRVARLLESDKPHVQVEGGLLKNYLKVVESAEAMQHERSVLTMEDGEIAAHWKNISQEVSECPDQLAQCLLKRRASKMSYAKDYVSLAKMMNPLRDVDEEGLSKLAFDPLQPSLSTLKVPLHAKMATFTTVANKEVLVDIIKKGSSGKSWVQNFANSFLEEFDKIDLVEVDEATTALVGACKGVWRALKALLSDVFSASSQELGDMKCLNRRLPHPAPGIMPSFRAFWLPRTHTSPERSCFIKK